MHRRTHAHTQRDTNQQRAETKTKKKAKMMTMSVSTAQRRRRRVMCYSFFLGCRSCGCVGAGPDIAPERVSPFRSLALSRSFCFWFWRFPLGTLRPSWKRGVWLTVALCTACTCVCKCASLCSVPFCFARVPSLWKASGG